MYGKFDCKIWKVVLVLKNWNTNLVILHGLRRKDKSNLEEVVEHVVVIAFRMVPGQADILVHVEGLDVLERDFSGTTIFNLGLIWLSCQDL